MRTLTIKCIEDIDLGLITTSLDTEGEWSNAEITGLLFQLLSAKTSYDREEANVKVSTKEQLNDQ